jgi:hypothetical protein
MLTAQLLNFGLIRKLGYAMGPDTPGDAEAVPFDVDDPVAVAHQLIFLATDIFEQELMRRRREAGVVSVRDKP